MTPRILLVQPPIYDFSAFDFWLKPYGLLRIAGQLRGKAELKLFDYLDRTHPALPDGLRADPWGCGEFYAEEIAKPEVFKTIPRRFRRYGIPRCYFEEFLKQEAPFDFVLVSTSMTYWYPGVKEVIDDARKYCPEAKIVLGGVYTTLCREHALTQGADLVISGEKTEPLWKMLGVTPDLEQPPFWEGYSSLESAVMKITNGCPFRCTYCSVPQHYPYFEARPQQMLAKELQALLQLGVNNIAFYDDALLARSDEILLPFLEHVLRQEASLSFHTPNALHARLINSRVADLMVRSGFKKVYLGFEITRAEWVKETGGKVSLPELESAVKALIGAGMERSDIAAYIIFGHPSANIEDIETSMRVAHDLGLRVMLSEFSPIPQTPDGELCRRWVDLDQPLWHNKTVFPMVLLGVDEVNRLKTYCHELTKKLKGLFPNSPEFGQAAASE